MKLRNLLLYITAFTLAAVNSSCKKDKNEDVPDPRVRRVLISEVGNDVEFIVNDVEGKIYNYDSLTYGTRVDSLFPNIYAYSGQTIKIQYSYDNVNFIDFRNTVAIDFTNPVSIISTNVEDNSKKEYTLEVRVHKYDVDAFQWTETGAIAELNDSILSQKSIMHDNTMWQFLQANSGCKVISSVDGSTWKSSDVTAPETLELSTLCNIDDSLFVQGKSGAIYAANFSSLNFNKFDAISGGQLLYTLNQQIWVLDNNTIKSYDKSGEAKVSQPMPAKFVVDTVRQFTAPSGYTTLGYLYAKKDNKTEIWGVDRYGNAECLTTAAEGLPYMDKSIAFYFDNTLGILGGIFVNGEYSTECYISENSGLSWRLDQHKDLTNSVGALADAGIFQTGSKGQFILVGGQTANGSSNKIWTLRLKKLLQEEAFLNKLK